MNKELQKSENKLPEIRIFWTGDKISSILDLFKKYIQEHRITVKEDVVQKDVPSAAAIDLVANAITIIEPQIIESGDKEKKNTDQDQKLG